MDRRRRRLAERRKVVGFSQERLAEAIGVETSTVARWERGETTPVAWHWPHLAEALKVSTDEVAELLAEGTGAAQREPREPNRSHQVAGHDQVSATAGSGPSGIGEIDEMNRRELLRLLSMAGAVLAMDRLDQLDWDRLQRTDDRSGRIDQAAVDQYASLNRQLWELFMSAPSKVALLPVVERQLGVLTTGLRSAGTEAIHRRLCWLAADLFQLAGEILFDGDRYAEAAHCYTLAATASREARAPDLLACALTRHAFIGVYERRFDHAAPMLELATTVARRGDSTLSTRHWAQIVHAQALAGLGELDACQRALDAAERVHDLTGQVHNGGWLRFDGSRLAEERGACYVELGRPHLAEPVLLDALAQDLSLRRRGGVLTDLAMIGVQRRDPTQVVMYASATLDVARQTHSAVIGRRLRHLQGCLAPLGSDGHVRHLSSQITALTTGHPSASEGDHVAE